jgi:hypothetical protein
MTKSLITSAIHGEPVWVKCDDLTEGGELLILPLTAPALERVQAELGICKRCGGRHYVEEGGRVVKCFTCSGKSPSFAEHGTRAKLLAKVLVSWEGLVEVDTKTGDEAAFEFAPANVDKLAARLDVFNLVFTLAAQLGGLRQEEQGKG